MSAIRKYPDAQIAWVASGNVNLGVAIDGDHVVTITNTNRGLDGTETITFTATDREVSPTRMRRPSR